MSAVRFFGPVNEHSGYGNAVINFAKAFSTSGVPTHFFFSKEMRQRYSVLDSLEHYDGKTDIDFYLHSPPWNKHKSLASRKIGYFYWEADKLPIVWARYLNTIDELWLPCPITLNACKRAGFRGLLKLVPTPIDLWECDERIRIPSMHVENGIVSDETYKFYSIFQWHERKGFRELITAYYREFTKHDDVLLILKVNPLNIAGYSKEKIKIQILEIKKKMGVKYYPPIYLSYEIVDKEQIRMLHKTGDCFISAHHGEGWGMSIHDAMIARRPIITTKFGGVTNYLSSDSADLIEYVLGPVRGMEWTNLYDESQSWAYPKISHLRELMRNRFQNRKDVSKCDAAYEIAKTLTTESISKIINKEI